ncbi:uncharacterized protein N7483_011609 [Penicillium malachiteum]|uniref:uncharacterized protein n=1 Tax=Penicillium malachiteum TaxID=1324776 RepID=UPI0025489C84|nr:uncharacterized protein N7483_011609 [Penicillium malachiteum]KAJ5714428.1 hypothetical protein N7483_011609 [Penicillium malachiteum]
MSEWRRPVSFILLVLARLSWSRTVSYYLPIPTWIPAVATIVSPVLGLILGVLSTWVLKSASQRDFEIWGIGIQRVLSALNQLHTILSTILATLALAYLYPEQLSTCNIEQQWQSMFKAKNADAIRTIQDSFQCCGLRSTRDRAWPFKDRTHGDNSCELQLGYTRSCLTPWRGQQQTASWMIFAAALLIVALKIGIASWSSRRSSWLNTTFSSNESQDYRRITNEETVNTESEANARTLDPFAENTWRE